MYVYVALNTKTLLAFFSLYVSHTLFCSISQQPQNPPGSASSQLAALPAHALCTNACVLWPEGKPWREFGVPLRHIHSLDGTSHLTPPNSTPRGISARLTRGASAVRPRCVRACLLVRRRPRRWPRGSLATRGRRRQGSGEGHHGLSSYAARRSDDSSFWGRRAQFSETKITIQSLYV